jgi:type IV pilus assembly protein PilQ
MTAGDSAKRVLASVLLIFFAACALTGNQVKSTGESEGEIRGITVNDLPDKTEIRVEGSQPMIYTTFRLDDPSRLIVDMAGVTFAENVKEIAVDNGIVTTVSPKTQDAVHVSRLEIGLSSAVEPTVRTEGTDLIVEAVKPIVANPEKNSFELAKGEDPLPPVTPASEAVQEEKLPKAKRINAVKVDGHGALKVIVTADGALDPQAFLLGKNRLVVDFVGVTTSIKSRVIPVKNNPQVRRVRLGKHPDKVRLVADLVEAVPYRFEHEKQALVLVLGAEEGQTPPVPVAIPQPDLEKPGPAGADPRGLKRDGEEISQKSPSSGEEVTPSESSKDGIEATVLAAVKESPADSVVEKPEPKRNEKKTQTPSPKATVNLENNHAPVPPAQVSVSRRFVGRKISLDFQDADIADVIRLIADVSGLNIVLGEDVKGKVTLKLVNVPWDQVLDTILKMNNLGQIRDGNIIRVASFANITRQQDEEAKAKETQIKAEDLVTRVIRLNYATATKLVVELKKNLSARGEISVDARTNTLVIKDIPRNLDVMANLVQSLDTQTPQVMIEARIVQVNPTFNRSLGIQWGGNLSTTYHNNAQVGVQGTQGATGPGGIVFGTTTPDFAVNLPASSSAGSLGFTLGRFTGNPLNLDLRLSAGEARGLTRVVSTPKVSVLDNEEAKIEQGETIPYSTTSASGTQTIFVDASLSLTVKPHITGDRSIIMNMKISKDAPGDTRTGAAGPSIFKKQATTNVLVKDGETTVIGGIFETNHVNSVTGVPFLMRIPILGWLFRTEDQNETKTELLVFITPRIL